MSSSTPDLRAAELWPVVIGAALGALVMACVDARAERRRRAEVRDLLVRAHGLERYADGWARHASHRLDGMMTRGRGDHATSHPPQDDAQLHERLRARIAHVVSHPKAIEVDVRDGEVRLHGHVLERELPGLLRAIEGATGVRALRNELQVHATTEGNPDLQGRKATRPSHPEPMPGH